MFTKSGEWGSWYGNNSGIIKCKQTSIYLDQKNINEILFSFSWKKVVIYWCFSSVNSTSFSFFGEYLPIFWDHKIGGGEKRKKKKRKKSPCLNLFMLAQHRLVSSYLGWYTRQVTKRYTPSSTSGWRRDSNGCNQDVHLQNGCTLTTPAPNHIENQGVPW
jgi:hypothetical protein